MVTALQIRSTGEQFRLVDRGSLWNLREGIPVQCVIAPLTQKRKGQRKKIFKAHDFFWDEKLYQIVEARPEELDEIELQRSNELVCRFFHNEKCSPASWESKQPVALTPLVDPFPRDEQKMFLKLVELSEKCLEYLQTPQKFDRTKLSVLTFEMLNILPMARRILKEKEEVRMVSG